MNPGNESFQTIVSKKYIDKSLLLDFLNDNICSPNKMICFTRPRRFGKSFAAKMIASYYDYTCDSHKLFENLKISKTTNYEKYINSFDVIYLDITQNISFVKDIEDFVDFIEKKVLQELKEVYSDFLTDDDNILAQTLLKIVSKTKRKFFFVIDEWDALFREAKDNLQIQKKYIQFFRSLFKGGPTTDSTIAGCYMTGILPIKKYGTESAMTDFREYTMLDPLNLTEFVGFTETEVKVLCSENKMDFENMKQWYDGYTFGESHIYNPNSVMQAIQNKKIKAYWTLSESYTSLQQYINMNFQGLKDDVISLLSNKNIVVDVSSFSNDLNNFTNKDTIFTILIHLGYLSYNEDNKEVSIPNLETFESFKNAVKDESWAEIGKAINESEQLLKATISGDTKKVSETLDKIHSQSSYILQYNDENSLSCALTIAYYTARKDYLIIREFPSGKGFADFAFIPRKNSSYPPLIIELKYDKKADSAIKQIKEKRYEGELQSYLSTVLLVGVNYDKKTKKHSCIIEKC